MSGSSTPGMITQPLPLFGVHVFSNFTQMMFVETKGTLMFITMVV